MKLWINDKLVICLSAHSTDLNIPHSKMDIDPHQDICEMVSPPGSNTSGYSSGSSLGFLSQPHPYPSIINMETETVVEDEIRGNMPFSQDEHDGLISREYSETGSLQMNFELSHAQFGTGE